MQIKCRDVGIRFIAAETDVTLFACDIRQAATNAFELLELSRSRTAAVDAISARDLETRQCLIILRQCPSHMRSDKPN